ncbi:MAG: hypothetical protein R3F39_20395 [Myxococcota bacterium]
MGPAGGPVLAGRARGHGVHDGLPALEPDALAVYVALLADACVAWSDEPDCLRVLFAEADRGRIAGLLAARADS